MKNTLLKIAGYLAVGLGFVGAFVPMLPTTPFLLLAVYCFSKSDPRMNRWMLQNRVFGRYLRDYRSGRGIPLSVKITVLSVMWSSMLFVGIVLNSRIWVAVLLFTVSLFVSIHILRIKTACHEKRKDRHTESDGA
ncbi:YbaN family protein [Alistipes sp. cv1]|uniref:YbaN family protein n=1 Tax=Alistipes sp. cv1 TaxID=1622071 RepID=UPI000C76AC40|nr:YbaN family protein [Alistipes sp. cv1]